MKLIFEHFRCFDKLTTIDFKEDKTICLLNGPSGIGKSSIFKGIEFCLYGTGTKCVTYNRKKCKVELFFGELHVTRTKTPNTLTVVYKEKTYTDLSAQSVINSIFGAHFHLTSIIHQKSVKHFFTCSASDKTLFLQSLIGDTAKIEMWKTECKKRSKEYRDKIAQITPQINFLKKNIDSNCSSINKPTIDKHIQKYMKQDGTPDITQIDTLIEQEENKIYNCTQNIKKLNSLSQSYERYAEYKREYSILEEKCVPLSFNGVLLSSIKECQTYLDSYMSQYTSKKQYESVSSEIDTITKKLNGINMGNSSINIPRYKSLLIILKNNKWDSVQMLCTQYETISKRIDTLQSKCILYESKKKEYMELSAKSKYMYECPNCQSSLLLIQSVLKQDTEQNAKEYKKILEDKLQELNEEEYKKNKQLVLTLQSKKKELDSIFPIVDNEKEYTIDSLTSTISNKELYDTLSTKLSVLETQKKHIRIHTEEYPSEREYQERVSVCMDYIQLCKEKEKYRGKLRDLEPTIHGFNKEELSAFSSAKEESELLVREYVQIKKQMVEYARIYQQYVTYSDFKCQLDEKEAQLETYNQQWVRIERFLSKIVQTESETIEELCNQLNRELDVYMQRFFPNKTIRMTVCSSKTTEEGEKKHCIDVQCFDHEANLITFDSLSGGEYDRCVLAFFLACNTYSGSPFILLDECLSSLHADAVEEIIELIKERCMDKFVCITLHQANLGLFDEVIQLDNM